VHQEKVNGLSEPIKITHYGPEPGPRSILYTAILDFDDGDIGGRFIDRKNIDAPYNYDEKMVYECMHICNIASQMPNLPQELRSDNKIQAEIFHYALASIQAEKLKLRRKPDKPLTPHKDVNMEFPKLRDASTPEI